MRREGLLSDGMRCSKWDEKHYNERNRTAAESDILGCSSLFPVEQIFDD